ncbi:MAG: hypothetical protein WBA54_13055 [Acidaminobacteraceae bacterium]
MYKYAIHANPGHNRIYFETALRIAISELEAISSVYSMKVENIEEGGTGLPASISFSTERELSNEDFKVLGSSSIYYALFEVVEGGLLRPISVPDFHFFPESMVQILKYNGKTNEQFTRLMVNLAVAACKTESKNLTLFDPMCGKGTTLYEGFIRGYNVKGIEIDSQWYQEIQNYVLRFLKEGKYKHKAQKSRKNDDKARKIADSFTLNAASSKEKFKKEEFQVFELLNADTRISDRILKKKSCDILISDLPYGVQHGSKSKDESSMDRSPIKLLEVAIPSWHKVLKTKGSIVLAFNEFTMKYDDLADVLRQSGFEVLNESPFNNYIHRVDQSINRNVIVAIKK